MIYLNKALKTLSLLIIILLVNSNISAQNKNAIKLNFTDLLINRYSISFERDIGNPLALALDLDLINQSVSLESNHPWYPFLMVKKKGFVFEPQLRIYFKSIGFMGFYTSLSGVFGYAEYKPINNSGYIEKNNWSSIGASLSLGYQKLILKKIALDFFLGCTLADDDYPLPYYESSVLFPAPDGIRLSGGVKLGLIF